MGPSRPLVADTRNAALTTALFRDLRFTVAVSDFCINNLCGQQEMRSPWCWVTIKHRDTTTAHPPRRQGKVGVRIDELGGR
jgi:hypothetical protein